MYKLISIYSFFGQRTSHALDKRKTMKRAEYEEMEKQLYSWFMKKRQQNVPISTDLLQQKARELFHEIYGETASFFASKGWLYNFQSRFGIKRLTISGERLSNNESAVKPFVNKFKDKVLELNLDRCQVYNADETALFWRKLPDKTLALRTEKSAPGRKIEKERITVLLCCNATGENKLKPLIIGKAQNPSSFRGENLPVEYTHSKNAWMTDMLFRKWFTYNFIPEVKSYLDKKNFPKKALLLLDNATCHSPELANISEDFHVMFLPPNCTALLQPMDQNRIRIFKINYRKSFLSHILSIMDNDLMKCLKKFTIKDAALVTATSWDSVKSNVLQKCWNKLLYNEEWGSEDDVPLSVLQENNAEPLNNFIDLLVNIAPDVYSQREVNEWIDDEDVETNYDSDNEHNEIQEENAIIELEQKVKHSEAVSSFNLCIKYAEENNFSALDIIKLRKLRENAVENKNNAIKQVTIDRFISQR